MRGARAALLCLVICSLGMNAAALSVMPVPDLHHTELHRAAERCDQERARAALARLAPEELDSRLNRLDREGYAPLAYAARGGCLGIVKLLIENGATVDAGREQHGWTALLHAAGQRHAETVRYLLAHGADVNVRTGIGKTALNEATLGLFFQYGPAGDRSGTIQALLEGGADVNLRGEYGWTPLIVASLRNDVETGALLIASGADISARDDKGNTASSHARERGEQELLKMLEERAASQE